MLSSNVAFRRGTLSGYMNSDRGKRLDSWKEIASFLGREIRTVQRWEDEGLPSPAPLKERARVYAYTADLEEWMLRRAPETSLPTASTAPEPEATKTEGRPLSRSRHWLFAGCLIGLVTFSLLGWMLFNVRNTDDPPPVRHGRLFARVTSEGSNPQWIELPWEPYRLKLSPDESTLYALSTEGSVAAINIETFAVKWEVRTGPKSHNMAISPDGSTLYVISAVNGLFLVDTKTQRVERLPTAAGVNDLALTRDGSELFLAMPQSGLWVFKPSTREMKQISTIRCPYNLATTEDGTRLFVGYRCGGPSGRPGHDSIDVMNVVTKKSIHVISGPPMVSSSLSSIPDGSSLWASAGDACSSMRYDSVGCPLVPGLAVHVFRSDDYRLVKSIGLPLHAVAGPPDLLLTPDSTRMIWTEGRLAIRVVNAGSYATEEMVPWPGAGNIVFSKRSPRAFFASRHAVAVLSTAPGVDPPREGLAELSQFAGFANAKSCRISEGYPKVFTTAKGWAATGFGARGGACDDLIRGGGWEGRVR